jgi:RNA polymerase sigma-70 factor, ECF subfamily
MSMERCGLQPKKDSALSMQETGAEIATKEGIASGEQSLIKRLKEGDESAFMQLVGQYHTSLLHLARRYVRSQSSAEEVVQETWMGVLQRLPFFEGRSSLKTWITRILIYQALTCAQREQRLIPFSALTEHTEESDALTVEPERIQGDEHSLTGAWSSLKQNRHDIPEVCLLALETQACVAETIETLPANQRAVIVLCDIEGWRPEEVSTRLGISTANQRVLLHRARSKVRRGLEKYFAEV